MTDMDRLTKVYLKIRAKKAEMQREHDERIRELDAQTATIEGLLFGAMFAGKIRSVRTDHGTAYLERIIKPSCKDWGAYHGFMIHTKNLEGLEKRVSKGFITDYMSEHPGETPPGITVLREDKVRVRSGNE